MSRSFPFDGTTVLLRAFETDDAPMLQDYLNHPALAGRRYIPWRFSEVAPLSRKQVDEIIQKWLEEEKALNLAVVQRESDTLIGHCQCDWRWDPHSASVAVVISPEHQRQGFGSKVFELLLRYLFKHTPAHNVSVWIADWNHPARQFVARHGLQEIGGMRRVGLRQGRYYDLVVADILRPEWQARYGDQVYGA